MQIVVNNLMVIVVNNLTVKQKDQEKVKEKRRIYLNICSQDIIAILEIE